MIKNKEKSITLNYQSFVGEELVGTLSATIPGSTGIGIVNQYVQNTELYNANRAEMRRDFAAIQADAYAIEDEMAAEKDLEVEA